MQNNFNQLNTTYIETQNVSTVIKFIAIFFVLLFIAIPLVEIVTDFNYNSISYYSKTNFCAMDIECFNVLSFKEIK